MGVTLKLSIMLTAIILLALGFGHDVWAAFFSDSTLMMSAFASMTPFVCISIFLDSIQGILSGTNKSSEFLAMIQLFQVHLTIFHWFFVFWIAVCRGCGWQHLAMYINLGTFYLIGMPIACLLAFRFNLYVKVKDSRFHTVLCNDSRRSYSNSILVVCAWFLGSLGWLNIRPCVSKRFTFLNNSTPKMDYNQAFWWRRTPSISLI